ncbi:hypothetical protein GCM10009558_097500 [Virgisporangium aurantiacum]
MTRDDRDLERRFPGADRELVYRELELDRILTRVQVGRSRDGATDEPSGIAIGLVTALPVESAAIRVMADDVRPVSVPGDPTLYFLAEMPSRDGGRHTVVIASQVQDGNRGAAAICAGLARSFPSLRHIVLCGIAGGFPQNGLRLGDIVSASDGIVDYDHVRSLPGGGQLRRPVEGMSKVLLAADRELLAQEALGSRPWLAHLAERRVPPLFARPLAVNDPRRTDRPDGPIVHRGSIGSADRLVRSARVRDQLATRFGVMAAEMEGSGVAVGADLHGVQWYVVRGISDYCDESKNDRWQPYAALAAASYVRALLAEVSAGLPASRAGTQPRESGLNAIVDVLLSLPVIEEEHQRQTLIRQLPSRIRTQIPSHQVPRLHVITLIQTCERFPDGADQLMRALETTMGGDAPELDRVRSVIGQHWRFSN